MNGGPGTFADLNGGEQKNWFEQAAGRGSSGIGAMQDLADATSPPQMAAATISGRMELLQTIASPGQALLDNGLGFLVSIVLSPLIEIAEWAIGDPEQMRATGNGWEQVATWLDEVAEAEQKRADATGGMWVGAAGDAFRNQITEFSGGVSALAEDVRGLKETLDMIADLFDMFVEFVIQILTELIIGLIVQWLAALAASWITAGGSVAAAGATTTVQVGSTGVRLTMRVTKLQMKLFQIMKKLEALLVRLRGPLRQVIQRMNGLRGGNMAEQALGRHLGSNPLVNILTRADGTSLASTTGNRFMQNITGEGALASNISQTVLSGMLGGETKLSTAAFSAGVDAAVDGAIKFGTQEAYDAAQNQPSEEERRETQERGFNW
ncbi:WXG100 family type VII secretion target [Saccharothrix deserti]|uniref:WXG100 family type VII secretion target n=1 Tax=Saccharothrix deserti TaxID=2593674 RepID=UPI001EE4D7D8|nr:WXG100 family type VII secretion target [Saccharothrix deserti]